MTRKSDWLVCLNCGTGYAGDPTDGGAHPEFRDLKRTVGSRCHDSSGGGYYEPPGCPGRLVSASTYKRLIEELGAEKGTRFDGPLSVLECGTVTGLSAEEQAKAWHVWKEVRRQSLRAQHERGVQYGTMVYPPAPRFVRPAARENAR